MTLRIGSICSGIGGLDLGIERATGATTAWHVEYDKHASQVLARHWPDVPNFGDVTAVDWNDVEPVDLILAGYPCQPFSLAGQRKGDQDDRHLWPFVADAIRRLRPRRVVLENVAGHRSLGFGRVLGDLAEAGYDAQWESVRASDVGAPHARERVFIVAAPTDTRRSRRQGPNGTRQEGVANRTRPTGRRSGSSIWGSYRAAIERWEAILGRPAPGPVDDRGRLATSFAEWFMGFDAGWVDGVSHRNAIHGLGNAVVPQVAELVGSLLDSIEVAA